MTPAQLASLAGSHLRAVNPDAAPKRADFADGAELLSLARMPV